MLGDGPLPDSLSRVVLIEKNRPAWQKGLLNFPGGHIEPGETPLECVIREFREETCMTTSECDWSYIGLIRNTDNYELHIFTAKYDEMKHGLLLSPTDEQTLWTYSSDPSLDTQCVSNVPWLIMFAINCWKQGNADILKFGTFDYTNS